ncbi:MAG: hypothetical protein ACON4H_02410 [Rubripirellula sp.]
MPGIVPIQRSQIQDGLEMTVIAIETNSSNAVQWICPKNLEEAFKWDLKAAQAGRCYGTIGCRPIIIQQ